MSDDNTKMYDSDGVNIGYFVFSQDNKKMITLVVESPDMPFDGQSYGSVIYNFLEQFGDKLDILIENELEHNTKYN